MCYDTAVIHGASCVQDDNRTCSYVLTTSSPNTRGIVAGFTTLLSEIGADITEAHQYGDTDTDRFFMRLVFSYSGTADDFRKLEERLQAVAMRVGATISLKTADARARVLIMVSRFDHCLLDLLYRLRVREFPAEIVGVVSNYPKEDFANIDLRGMPFHYLPVTAATKAKQEQKLLDIVQQSAVDLVVLARYMQVLSDDAAKALSGRCINIHHSFLPGFKGARPYQQAKERGVKIIGATAHYVTGDLDEGPIIEQDVERISHLDSLDDIVRKGRDIERRVLAGAVRNHLEGRVFINGKTTVVLHN